MFVSIYLGFQTVGLAQNTLDTKIPWPQNDPENEFHNPSIPEPTNLDDLTMVELFLSTSGREVNIEGANMDWDSSVQSQWTKMCKIGWSYSGLLNE